MRLKRPGLILLYTAVLFAPILNINVSTHSQTYAAESASQADLKKINSAIQQVQNRIKTTSTQRSSVHSEITKSEQEISRLNSEISSISTQIDTEEDTLRTFKQQSAELEKSKIQQQTLIGQYLRSAYQTGQQEYLKLLLNQQSIEESARIMQYYKYFNQARAEKVSTFNATITKLALLQNDIKASSAQLLTSRSQLNEQQNQLSNSQSNRQNLLKELDETLNSSGTELARLQRERAEMEILIEELSRTIANISLGDLDQPFAKRKGRLPWPVTGRLLNSYGASYELGDLNWEGVTIAGTAGAAVQAIHHGHVVFSDWFANSGLLLIIDHGDGYMTLYAHNQLLYKEVGDWVSSGETIAAIGNTGGRKENGVYFEIRHNGKSTDPVNWCLARK